MRGKLGRMAVATMFFALLLSGCGGGGGGSSAPGVPAAPTSVTPAAGPGEVTISWANVAGATSYNIYYSTTTGVTPANGTPVDNVTSPHIVPGLTNGTAYYFIVTAVNSVGQSAASAQVSATPMPNPPPPAPDNVTATAGHGEVTISWNNVGSATSYNIYYSTTTPVTKATGNKLTGRTSPSIVTGLVNSTTYYFVVTSVNADGESVESAQVSAIPTAAPPPAAPTNVTATAGPGQVTIAWDNAATATSYNIYYSTTTGVTKATGTKVAGVTSPRAVTGLIRGTTYYFVVTALNSDNVESVESSQVSAIPTPPSPSYSVSDLSGTWNVRVVLSADSPGWYGFTATVDGAGNVTPSGNLGPATPPALPGLVITSTGTVTESGAGSNATFSGQMSTSKNLIVGTSTASGGTTFALHVFVKRVPGITFSSADLANVSINYQRIYTGASDFWERGTGLVNGTGTTLTLASVVDSSGPIAPPYASTGISIDGTTGIVTMSQEPTFSGAMTSDKKLIVGASTDGGGIYSLRVMQVRGQTYTQPDLGGAYRAFAFHSATPSSWARATWTTVGTTVTISDYSDSSGGPPPPPPATFDQTLNALGDTGDGSLSFGKDLLVTNGDFSNGSAFEMKVQ